MMDEIETAITMTTSTNNLNTTPTFSSSVSSMSFIPSTQCVNQVAPAPPMEIYGFRFSQEVIPDPPPRRFILKKKNSLIKTYQRAIKKRSSRTVNKKKFKTKLSTEVTEYKFPVSWAVHEINKRVVETEPESFFDLGPVHQVEMNNQQTFTN